MWLDLVHASASCVGLALRQLADGGEVENVLHHLIHRLPYIALGADACYAARSLMMSIC